jgi:hypothetical protein
MQCPAVCPRGHGSRCAPNLQGATRGFRVLVLLAGQAAAQRSVLPALGTSGTGHAQGFPVRCATGSWSTSCETRGWRRSSPPRSTSPRWSRWLQRQAPLCRSSAARQAGGRADGRTDRQAGRHFIARPKIGCSSSSQPCVPAGRLLVAGFSEPYCG